MSLTREAFFRWMVTHRRSVAAIGALVIGGAGSRATLVPIDYAIEQFFPPSGVERDTFDEYKEHFAKEDGQFVLFWEAEDGPSIRLCQDLGRAARLFEEVGLEDVQWFGDVEVTETGALDGGASLAVYRLCDEAAVSDSTVRDRVERHRADVLLTGFLWNAEQTVFALHGYLPPDLKTDQKRREVEEALTESLASLGIDGAAATLAGVPVYRSRIPKMLQLDQTLFLGGGFLVFFGILFYFFRHIGHVSLCLVSVLPAYLCTLALMGAAGRSITVLTSFIPIIVLVVGVSDAIHLLARYRHSRNVFSDNEGAIVDTFSRLSVACLYTSATTAIGFLSLVGTRITIVMEFGIFTAVAIMLTYVFSMTLLPALLGFSSRRASDERGLTPGWILKIVDAAVGVPRQRARAAVLLFALVSLGCVTLGSTLRVNTFLLDDMGPNSPVMRDLARIEASGFGLFQVNIFLRGTEGDVLHDPAMLRWMASFEDFARGEAVVVNATGLADVLAELRRAWVDDEPGALPESPEEAAELLLLAQISGNDGVEDVYLQDEGVAQVILTVRDEGSVSMLPFIVRLEQYLADYPPPFGTAAVTGTVQLAQTFSEQLVRSFGPSLMLAILLVFGVMTHMFRSVRLGALAVVPNLFPLLVIMGAMKLAGVDLKPSTILVFSIAFGLAVDDTMHFLSRLRESLAAGIDMGTAVEDALRDTGPPILMTSLAVSGGFLLLAASQFQILVLVGVMTAVSTVAAVAADMFALPSLIAVLSRSTSGRDA